MRDPNKHSSAVESKHPVLSTYQARRAAIAGRWREINAIEDDTARAADGLVFLRSLDLFGLGILGEIMEEDGAEVLPFQPQPEDSLLIEGAGMETAETVLPFGDAGIEE